jgi:hypothetical protein
VQECVGCRIAGRGEILGVEEHDIATAEFAEMGVLGFVVAGPLNAVVNTRAVVRYLGGNVVLSNLLAAVRPDPASGYRMRRSPQRPACFSRPACW